MLRSAVLVLACSAPVVAQAAAPATIDFDRDIKPLLADRCFACHGPDAGSRKAGLRLDRRDALVTERPATKDRPARRIVAPGDPAGSELLRRIAATDSDERMPPARSKLPRLTDAEVDRIRGWIEQGAEWSEHWAFVPPPHDVAVPQDDTARNPIDAFVRATLREQGLRPSPAADEMQLLRRATLDLTGLPPTLDELDAFAADPSPDRFERAVDRLLESPRFGERLAADWLDVARYADTHGYQADRYRAVWQWRDWVVTAFNRNLAYDEFLRWQLAGDLLPNATREQQLATTFNRLHRQTEEGGTIEEEFRVEYVADRAETVGAGMLGLTLGCARCHDHKYDPISQREYYAMFAFFQNIDESGQTSHFTDAVPVPTLRLTDEAQDAELDALAEHVRTAEAALADAVTQCGRAVRRVAGDALRRRSRAPDRSVPARRRRRRQARQPRAR